MKKLVAIVPLLLLIFALTGCTDTWHGDDSNDAYAQIVTSDGRAITVAANLYRNEVYTAQAKAIAHPYDLYLPDEVSATITFACTACGHSETLEGITAPYANMFNCDCVTGDNDPNMTEYLAINVVLGEPPVEADDE